MGDGLTGSRPVGGGDDGGLGQGVVVVLRADAHAHPVLAGRGVIGEQAQQHHLLLNGVQEGAQGGEVRCGASQVRSPGDDEPLLGVGAQRGDELIGHGIEQVALVGGGLLGQGCEDGTDVGGAAAHEGTVEAGAQAFEDEGVDDVGDVEAGLMTVSRAGPGPEGHGALVDAAGVGDDDQQDALGPQGHELEVLEGGVPEAGVLDDGELPGQLGQGPHGTGHHLLQVDRPGQESGDGGTLGSGQGLDTGDLVDEEPVALLGGHAPGRRVRLVDVALVLQGRHVVADGGRGDAQAVALHEGLGAHGLTRAHVVGDDGGQDLESSVVGHGSSSPSSVPGHGRHGVGAGHVLVQCRRSDVVRLSAAPARTGERLALTPRECHPTP